ncbi:MAG: GTP-binding protein [Candidatus Helarchaeota archaeon]
MSEEVWVFKLVIIGDPGVGKTSLLLRYIENRFEEEYLSTIGVDFYIQNINIDNKEVKLQIWDTGGQEKFSYMRPGYYIGSVGAILVYDVTNPMSFQNLKIWMDEVHKYCPGIPIILAENKIDLPRVISKNQVTEFITKYKILAFETSAKNSTNVEEMFKYFSQILLNLRVKPSKLELFTTLSQTEITENYRRCSEHAVELIRNGDYERAVHALEKAFIYSNGIGFQAGIQWIQEQIIFISQLISDGIPAKTNPSMEVNGLKPMLKKPQVLTRPIKEPNRIIPSTVISILDSIRDKLVFGISLSNLISRLSNAKDTIIQIHESNLVTMDMEKTIKELSQIKDNFTLINPELRRKIFSKIYEWKNQLIGG